MLRDRARRGRPDEHAVRDSQQRCLHPRGQPARVAHGAVREQGDRQAAREDRDQGDGRQDASAGARRVPRRCEVACRGTSAVKEVVFPFVKFEGVDTILRAWRCARPGRGHGHRRATSRARSRRASSPAGMTAADRGRLAFLSVREVDKPAGRRDRAPARRRSGSRWSRPTARRRCCARRASTVEPASTRSSKDGTHQLDAMDNGEIQFVINTTDGAQARSRRLAVAAARGADRLDRLLHDAARRAAALEAIAVARRGDLRRPGFAKYTT